MVISYRGGDGNDVVLTAQLPALAVPSLGPVGLLLIGLLGSLGSLHLRRKS